MTGIDTKGAARISVRQVQIPRELLVYCTTGTDTKGAASILYDRYRYQGRQVQIPRKLLEYLYDRYRYQGSC